MNRVNDFFNEKFGSVRAIEIDGKTYFDGDYITKALGYLNGRKAIATYCKYPLKIDIDMIYKNISEYQKSRKKKKIYVICKSDIYRLIIQSEISSSEEFQTLMFDDIIPAIERTGTYSECNFEDGIIDRYLSSVNDDIRILMLKDLQKAIKVANETIRRKDEIIASQKKRMSLIEDASMMENILEVISRFYKLATSDRSDLNDDEKWFLEYVEFDFAKAIIRDWGYGNALEIANHILSFINNK